MTTPKPTTQSNSKAWVSFIGGLIISQLPLILQFLGHLPAPYGVIATGIGMILAAITGKGTHQVSNAPDGTVLVPVPKPDVTQPPGGSGWPNS